MTGARIRIAQYLLNLAGHKFFQGLDKELGGEDIEACVRME
jgi:hypothetical protein